MNMVGMGVAIHHIHTYIHAIHPSVHAHNHPCNTSSTSTTGSIFGIYSPSEECSVEDMDDPEGMMQKCIVNVCQPGNSLLCAGYALYSTSTVLVLTVGNGVYGFTLDTLLHEFVLTHREIKMPEVGRLLVKLSSTWLCVYCRICCVPTI